jgi:hypothetical protein
MVSFLPLILHRAAERSQGEFLTQRRGGAESDAEEEKSSEINDVFNGCGTDFSGFRGRFGWWYVYYERGTAKRF